MSYYEEIKEGDKNYIIRIEGIKVAKDKIKIDASENSIDLRIGDEVIHYDTPEINPMRTSAKFEEGILTINSELKKRKEDKEIEVNIKDLKEEVIKDLKNRMLYQQAEFENQIKRINKEKEEAEKYANRKLIEKLLSILDAFEIALKDNKNKNEENKNIKIEEKNYKDKFYEGMKMIYNNLKKILEEENLREIDAVGKKFDPYYHEALFQEENNDLPEETVTGEIQKGYTLNSKVIRTSKVKISKKPVNKSTNQDN